MQFNAKNIKPYVKGTRIVYDEGGAIGFDRFTAEQRAIYAEGTVAHARTYTLPGVRLDFETDAKTLAFSSVNNRITKSASSVRFFFDVTVNGCLYASKGVTRPIDKENPEKNNVEDTSFSFALPEGEKRVSLYFPPLFKVSLKDVELTGETFVRPVKNARTIAFFGDSITEDCSVYHTSLSYANTAARALDAEIFNYAIGGERFNPQKFSVAYRKTDAAVSMYGTNEIFGKDMFRFVRGVEGYLEGLRKAFPTKPVFVILPPPRLNGGFDTVRVIPSMDFIRDEIRLAIEKRGWRNFHIIDGKSLMPPMPEFYFDGTTHPNDMGHTLLGEGVAREIKKILG